MTFRLFNFHGTLWVLLGLVLLAGGCGEQDDQVLGPAGDLCTTDSYTWLWAFSADDDSLRVYDTDTGQLHATFHAEPHALLREVMAGPEALPSVWMGSGGTGYGFTAGFESHGDHAHMILPTSLGTVPTGAGNTHLTTDPLGNTISWANDGDQNFTLVDAETRTPVTVGHGSPHSSSLVADGTLVATHMNEKWARFIDVDSGALLSEVAIDTLAHGEAFHSASGRAFIPCLGGVTVLGLQEQENMGEIAYPGSGRVNFLFGSHARDKVLAPVKLDGANASVVWILDMLHQSMEEIAIPASALAWNRGQGGLCVSADGNTAALTDLESNRAYVLNLADGSVENLTTEAANMACAISFDGQKLWLLEKGTGTIHFRYLADGVWEEGSSFPVDPGSQFIFITSLDPAVEIIREY